MSLPKPMTDDDYMKLALAEAKKAAERGEVPIGAVLVDSTTGEIVAADGNRTIEHHDPTGHAEILVIRAAAAAIKNERLLQYDLYVTLEPCAMCAAAISFARVSRLIYSATDPKGGGVDHGARFYKQSTCHHRPEVTSGMRHDEAGQLLKSFFKARRGGKMKGRSQSIE